MWTLIVVYCAMALPQECVKLAYMGLTQAECAGKHEYLWRNDNVLKEDGSIDEGVHIVRAYCLRLGDLDTQGDGVDG